jgi:hypothetical protein
MERMDGRHALVVHRAINALGCPLPHACWLLVFLVFLYVPLLLCLLLTICVVTCGMAHRCCEHQLLL